MDKRMMEVEYSVLETTASKEPNPINILDLELLPVYLPGALFPFCCMIITFILLKIEKRKKMRKERKQIYGF